MKLKVIFENLPLYLRQVSPFCFKIFCIYWLYSLFILRYLVASVKHCVEENIWTEEGRGKGGMEEIA